MGSLGSTAPSSLCRNVVPMDGHVVLQPGNSLVEPQQNCHLLVAKSRLESENRFLLKLIKENKKTAMRSKLKKN